MRVPGDLARASPIRSRSKSDSPAGLNAAGGVKIRKGRYFVLEIESFFCKL
jgi:hypothetical protein